MDFLTKNRTFLYKARTSNQSSNFCISQYMGTIGSISEKNYFKYSISYIFFFLFHIFKLQIEVNLIVHLTSFYPYIFNFTCPHNALESLLRLIQGIPCFVFVLFWNHAWMYEIYHCAPSPLLVYIYGVYCTIKSFLWVQRIVFDRTSFGSLFDCHLYQERTFVNKNFNKPKMKNTYSI